MAIMITTAAPSEEPRDEAQPTPDAAPQRPGAARALLPEPEREAFAANSIVRHLQFREALAALQLAYDELGVLPEPYCVFVSGRSGCGKTTLAAEFAKPYERYVAGSTVVAPILRVTLPSPATPVSVADRILAALGDPLNGTGSLATMTRRLIKLLGAAGVRVLVLDELHSLIEAKSHHVLRSASEWVKTLLIETGIAIVAFGRPEASIVFEYNDQLQRRFGRRIELPRFGFVQPSEVKRFRSFLAFLDAELPLPEASGLAAMDVAARLYFLSDGVVDYLMKVVRGATIAAIRTGQPRLTVDLLANAYDVYVAGSRPDRTNPFRDPTFNVLKAANADTQAASWVDQLAQGRSSKATSARDILRK
jgi:hypothetical protein